MAAKRLFSSGKNSGLVGELWFDSRDPKRLNCNDGRNAHIAAHPCAARDSI